MATRASGFSSRARLPCALAALLLGAFAGANTACSGSSEPPPVGSSAGSAGLAGALSGAAGGTTESVAGATAVGGGGGGAAASGGSANETSGGAEQVGGPSAGAAGSTAGAATSGSGGSAGSAGGTAAGGASGYQPCPASPCVILPLGDSITYGYGTTTAAGDDEASPGGYRVRLFSAALADSKTLTFVGSLADGPTTVSGQAFPRSHEGHASFTIDGAKGITQFVDDGIISKFKPNIVLLMIGTNDVSQSLDLANAPSRLGKLMDKIYAGAPDALIVVAKITPSQKEPANTNTSAYNAALPGVVQQRVAQGKHAVVVDMNQPFVANANWKKELMRDSVHPNNAGYQILSATWYAAIKGYLR